jgi:uncharacterized membrane protein YphA (DoxX/SURF4 family)
MDGPIKSALSDESPHALPRPVLSLFAWMATLSEFGGDLLILLGLLTSLAAAFIVSTIDRDNGLISRQKRLFK